MKKNRLFGAIAIFLGLLFSQFDTIQAMEFLDRSHKMLEVKHVKEADQRDLEIKLEDQAQQRKKKCYDLMMILDADTEKNNPPSMFYDLILGCSNSSFPIIVSSSVVENYCLCKKDPNKFPALLADYADQAEKFYPTDNDWFCYGHKTAPLILLIPKKYIAQFAQEKRNLSLQDKLTESGFDYSNLQAFESLLPDTLLSYIAKQEPTNSNIRASDIESFFLKPTQTSVPYVPSWNIYLAGHGHVLIGIDEKTAGIGGLRENEFFKLMKIFEKIKTSFLFYSTCYSAGQNLIKVQRELGKLTVGFMVATRGFNESAISTGRIDLRKFFNNLETFFGNPKDFFLEIKNAGLSEDPISFLVRPVIDKARLDASQPWIYIPPAGVFNAFFVDKSVKILTKSLTYAHEFEGKDIDFTNKDIRTIIVYSEYIGAPVNIKAHTAIVSPTGLIIKAEPVTFKKQKKEKEEDPDIWTANKSTSNIIHFFENITYEDKLSSVIPNFVSFQSSFLPIIFVIKKLMCFDYKNSDLSYDVDHMIILKNVIIFNYQRNITVLFDYNNSTYSFNLEISDLWNNSKKLFDQFANLPPSKLDPTALSELLAKRDLLKHCGLDENSGKYTSLGNIIEDIQVSIDKEIVVKEPGKLKNVLLKQYAKQQSSRPWSSRISAFFRNASKAFSNIIKNIKKKIFSEKQQKKPAKQYSQKQR